MYSGRPIAGRALARNIGGNARPDGHLTYLISYHLQKLGKDYSSLMDTLNHLGAHRVLLSQWIVTGAHSASELAAVLREHMDEKDRLLVVQVAGDVVWSNVFQADAQMEQLTRAAARPPHVVPPRSRGSRSGDSRIAAPFSAR